jgi:citrate lyase alpha subunit
MNPYNQVSFLPPSPNYFCDYLEKEKEAERLTEEELYSRFKETNYVDLIRTRGFVHHPSRETNSIVEGEIFRNEQDKIVESMRIMVAEYGVKKGIWKTINHAFQESDNLKKKKFKQIFYEQIEKQSGLDRLY